jgi:signal transduction histidine kinase
VKAANSDGVWNEAGTQVHLYIHPPIWQQRWFRAAAVILSGLLIYAFYKVRVRSIELQNRQLEILVKQRTDELKQRSLELEQSLLETKQQKQEAEYQRKLAEEANRIKTELTNITVHDLKGPLGGISLYTDLIKESISNSDKVIRLAQTIKETSQIMLHLVSNLLKRAKLESNYISLQKEKIDIALLLRVAVQRNQLLALHKEQQLHYEEKAGYYAEVDIDLMNDVLENLITNAIKFTPKAKSIFVSLTATADKIIIAVKDEGPGIRKEEMKKLFQPFQRLSARPTGGESSTGLGLAITKQIVELHGGTIQVESKIHHQGSTFTVSIPAYTIPEFAFTNSKE